MVIVLSVLLQLTASYYIFGIFKCFLSNDFASFYNLFFMDCGTVQTVCWFFISFYYPTLHAFLMAVKGGATICLYYNLLS
jgi:hypothetical protein